MEEWLSFGIYSFLFLVLHLLTLYAESLKLLTTNVFSAFETIFFYVSLKSTNNCCVKSWVKDHITGRLTGKSSSKAEAQFLLCEELLVYKFGGLVEGKSNTL